MPLSRIAAMLPTNKVRCRSLFIRVFIFAFLQSLESRPGNDPAGSIDG